MELEFCLLFSRTKLHMALVKRADAKKGGRLEVLFSDGKEAFVPTGAVAYRWNETIQSPGLEKEWDSKTPPPGLASYLKEAVQAFWEETNGFHAETIYQTLHQSKGVPGEEGEMVFKELSDQILPPLANPRTQAALFAALLESPIWFRHRRGVFFIPSFEQVKEKQRLEKQKHEQEQLAEKAKNWVKNLEQGKAPESFDASDEKPLWFSEILISLIAHEKKSPHWVTLAKELDLKTGQKPRVKKWLEALGAWPGWPAIWCLEADVMQGFSQDLLAESEKLARQPLRVEGCVDYRSVETLTIDPEGTTEFDDAISILNVDENGIEVALHITLVPEEFDGGHPLFEEARKRGFTVYTTEAVFPMLPDDISSGRHSLLAGQEREALSLVFRLTPSKQKFLKMEHSLIKVRENLTYAQGANLIKNQGDTWGKLVAYCEKLAKGRFDAGAVEPNRMGVLLDVSDPGAVTCERYERQGPLHRLVEEMAILYNKTAAEYCKENNLPALYRVQAKKNPGENARYRMSSALSVNPGPHRGIGAEVYLQATSPLRRFGDMLVQKQISAHLARRPLPVSQPAVLAGWAGALEARNTVVSQLERRVQNYWKRVFLSQHPEGLYTGEVRKDGDSGKVFLKDVLLVADATLPYHLHPGDVARFQLVEADLSGETARVKYVD